MQMMTHDLLLAFKRILVVVSFFQHNFHGLITETVNRIIWFTNNMFYLEENIFLKMRKISYNRGFT